MKRKEDEDLLKEARAIASFKIHVSVYIVIVGLLWVIWFINGGMDIHPWPIYPTIAWGAGLFFHYLTAYGIYRSIEKKEEQIN
jgi:hypothetical protein